MKDSYVFDNRLTVHIPDEKRNEIIKNIITYMIYDNSLFYYLLFGYEEYNIDISNYIEKYTQLKNDKGFILIDKEDIVNTTFISDILSEFQIASLYINKVSNLENNFNFRTMRNSQSSFEGYVIQGMEFNYITLIKGSDLPAWNLAQMGILEEMITNTNTDKGRKIVNLIKKLFSKNL